MSTVQKAGLPLVGVTFLGLAVLKFLHGDDWVVWAILGALFGGLSIFRAKKTGGGEA